MRGKGWKIPLTGLLGLFLAGWIAAFWVPLPAALSLAPSPVLAYADGAVAHVFLSADEKIRLPVDLARVDPLYLRALLGLEDRRFSWHPGVDPLALVRALFQNLRAERVRSGASTLTMQLARLLAPRPRTLGAKIQEALRALQLEVRLSKREILGAYLERIPFGGNLEGLETASFAYFGHDAQHLSAEEIAILLAVPQNPNRRCPGVENRLRLERAARAVARRLERFFPALAGLAGRSLSDLARLRPVPRAHPHAARWLRERRRGNLGPVIRSTLDRGTQRLLEDLLRAAEPTLRSQGIHNAAGVIVEHATRQVRALLGNLDFWDQAHGGQIVGFAEPRSAGSTLKPFLYALALDRGLILPEQLVPDIPVRFGTYAPRNADAEFSGLISVEDALSRSLNVPFVQLLNRVGVEPFVGLFRSAGLSSLGEGALSYGLSAAVGGVELSPLDLAALYAALAEGGEFQPLRLEQQIGPERGPRLLSGGAAFLVKRALSRRDRPDFPSRRDYGGLPARIHWKTGTSYGHRDAWSAGSGPRFTAVVWLGNFDRTPSVDLVGAQAGPILFDLLEALEGQPRAQLDPPPGDLTQVKICAYSGFLPGPGCPHTKMALAMRNHVPTARCPYHVQAEVDGRTGLAVNPGCRDSHPTVTQSFLTWPASIARYLSGRHKLLPPLPPLAPDCAPPADPEPPRILSPAHGLISLLIPGLRPDRQEIPLLAESSSPRSALHWFLDGRYLGSCRADQRLWWPPSPGQHVLRVVDDSGLFATQALEVRHRP